MSSEPPPLFYAVDTWVTTQVLSDIDLNCAILCSRHRRVHINYDSFRRVPSRMGSCEKWNAIRIYLLSSWSDNFHKRWREMAYCTRKLSARCIVMLLLSFFFFQNILCIPTAQVTCPAHQKQTGADLNLNNANSLYVPCVCVWNSSS